MTPWFRSSPWRAALLACLLAGLPASSVRAQQKEGQGTSLTEARAHLRAGEKLYLAERYEEAAREMEAAYAIRPAADLQYNVAQCYERLGRHEAARAAYRRYLDGKPDADDRAAILARIAELERQGRPGAAAPPPPVERVVLKTVVVYREAPPPPGRGARFAGYAVSALAVAGLASGVTFALLARDNAELVEAGGSLERPTVWGGQVADADSAGRTQAVVSAVSFGVAGVAAVGAALLFVLGSKIDREAREAREGGDGGLSRAAARPGPPLLVPLLPAGGGPAAGLAAVGRF